LRGVGLPLQAESTGVTTGDVFPQVVQAADIISSFETARLQWEGLVQVPDGNVGVASGTVVAHLDFGFHSRASLFASASWSEVIRMASASRSMAPDFPPFAAPNMYHI